MFDLVAAVAIVASDLGGAAIGKAMMIDLDESAEIRGVDANNNGIRDDFERMLIKKVKDDKQRNMLYHMLSFMDKAIVFGNTKGEADQEEALELFKSYNLGKIFQCVSRSEKSLYTFIDKNYPNTKERKQAYASYNMTFSKTKFKSRTPLGGCDEYAASIPDYVSTEFKAKADASDATAATDVEQKAN